MKVSNFDAQGLLAKAKFHVNYKGKAIIKPLQQVRPVIVKTCFYDDLEIAIYRFNPKTMRLIL